MVGRYEAYPEYKDSEVEWLGKAPCEWGIVKMSEIALTVREQVLPKEIESEIVTHYSIPNVQEVGLGKSEEGETIDSNKFLIKEGDILFSKLNPRKQTITTVIAHKNKVVASTEFIVLRTGLGNQKYIKYLLLCPELKNFICGQVESATKSHQRITPSAISKLKFCIPSYDERKQIANFLDHETAKIDTLIEKQQQLIKLLGEKRQAVISHAVTKGLNPDTPMKDSGVEWLGEVPEHWDVVMLGKKIQLQRGVDITKDQQSPGEIPVVSSGGISSYHDKATCKGPGVVVGRKGTAGKLHYINSDFWAHDTTLYVKDFRENLPRYVYYKLISMKLETYDTGSANPTLNRNIIHPVKVSWSPVVEQPEIVAYLDHFCLQAEKTIEKTNCAIMLLQERRTALISAAVTGKIDVRNWKPPASQNN